MKNGGLGIGFHVERVGFGYGEGARRTRSLRCAGVSRQRGAPRGQIIIHGFMRFAIEVLLVIASFTLALLYVLSTRISQPLLKSG